MSFDITTHSVIGVTIDPWSIDEVTEDIEFLTTEGSDARKYRKIARFVCSRGIFRLEGITADGKLNASESAELLDDTGTAINSSAVGTVITTLGTDSSDYGAIVSVGNEIAIDGPPGGSTYRQYTTWEAVSTWEEYPHDGPGVGT